MEKTENHYQENVSQRERKSILTGQNWQATIAIVAIATLAFTLYFNLDSKIVNVQKDLNAKIDNVQKDLNARIDRVEDKIDNVQKDLNAKIDKVNERLDKVIDLLMSRK